MTLYGVLLAVATLGIAVVIGLGLSNGGQGGEPYWPVVLAGVGLLLCKLVVIGVLARHRPADIAGVTGYCRPCSEILAGKKAEHCGERGPDCGYGCACPCPREGRN